MIRKYAMMPLVLRIHA